MYVCALFSADVTQPKGSKKERQRYKVKYIHRETISKMHNISTNKIHQNTGNAWCERTFHSPSHVVPMCAYRRLFDMGQNK